MSQVTFIAKEKSVFALEDNGERIGEMIVDIDGNDMTVYHTEVAEHRQGQGLGKHLIDGMAAYAREHKLKIVPICPYVKAVFKKSPDHYADIWKK